MLQLRPTFSESWYRVANLKPRLRAGTQLSRQYYRGDRWYVVRDPAGNQFHRLSDPAYRFIGLLDGKRTVAEAWELVGGTLADDAPTQPEVIQILSQLYAANLLETDVTPDATVLLRRHKKMVQQKMQNRLMNVLFPRLPLWDPDRFLVRWMPVAKNIFNRIGAVIWCIVLALALATVLPRWNDLRLMAIHSLDMRHNVENLFWLYLTFILIKLMHELGHAFACRRFGGECHELGIMLLVLVPTPYVDASSAWAFPSRWARMFVGAAGMIVELFFASLCAFVWAYTNPANYPLINQLAYNAMLIASVSTIIFNANPLLRYDGYYILSDLLEIPNLRQKSVEYTLGLIKRHVFRLKLQQPLPPMGQRAWLLSYSILSNIYRVFIGIIIMLVVVNEVPVLGILMAVGGAITWAAVPLFQLGKYLMLDPELHRKRGRAWAFSGSVAAVVILLLGVIRFPMRVEFPAVLQPDDPRTPAGVLQTGMLITGGEGRVVQISARDGQLVSAGQPILRMVDPDVQHDIDVDQARIAETSARIRAARVTDQNELEKDQADLLAWDTKLHIAEERLDDLTLKAPFAGRLVAPNLSELQNTFLQRGEPVGRVAVLSKLILRGDINQKDAELVTNNPSLVAEVRLAGLLDHPLRAENVFVSRAAVTTIADPSLGTQAGGDVQVDPTDPHGMRLEVPQFEARATLANPTENIYPGQRAYVMLTLKPHPLAWQWMIRFYQLWNTESTGRWL